MKTIKTYKQSNTDSTMARDTSLRDISKNSLQLRERSYHNSVCSPQNLNIIVEWTVLTQHLAEIGVVQVRILVGQLLPLHFGPHHKRIHRPSYPLLFQGFLLLLVTMVIVVMVMVTGMNPNFNSGSTTRYIHLSPRCKMMLITLMM